MRNSSDMANIEQPAWLIQVLDILRQAGIKPRFILLYNNGQTEVGLILDGAPVNEIPLHVEAKP